MTNVDGKSPTMDSDRGEEQNTSDTGDVVTNDPIDDYIEASIIIKGTKCNQCCNDVDLKKDAIQCFICSNFFHASCYRDYRDICSPSALTGHFIPAVGNGGPYEKRFGRFLFACDFCACNRINNLFTANEDSPCQNDLNVKVDSLSNDVVSMKTEFNNELSSLKCMLSQVLNSVVTRNQADNIDNAEEITAEINTSVSDQTAPSSYADIVSFPPISPEQSQQLLHISQTDVSSLTPDEVSEKVVNVKQKIAASLKNVPTNFVKSNNQKGSVTVAFPNNQTREKAAQILNDLNLPLEGFQTKEAKKLLPKLTILGIEPSIFDSVDSSLTAEEKRVQQKSIIKSSIMCKNEGIKSLIDIGHTLEVVYLNKSQNSTKFTVGIKVSPSIRSFVFQNQHGKLFIGNNSLFVEDRFFFKQCYHCQQVGHFSSDCPDTEKSPVCFYCMGSHLSKLCNKKKSVTHHCCAKCFHSKVPGEKADYKSHNAADSGCPVVLREIQKIANNTEICSKNVM